jgi:hypothetical protein
MVVSDVAVVDGTAQVKRIASFSFGANSWLSQAWSAMGNHPSPSSSRMRYRVAWGMPITGLSPRSRAAMLGSTLLRQAPS